jgi:hypothetical protein
MSIMQLPKKEKTKFFFELPKDLEKEWRKWVADKHGGYHRGAYSKEVEAAIRRQMESEKQ